MQMQNPVQPFCCTHDLCQNSLRLSVTATFSNFNILSIVAVTELHNCSTSQAGTYSTLNKW